MSLTFCLCGGGALSHVFAGVLGANSNVIVRVLTRQPNRWQRVIRVLYRDEAELHGTVAQVSNDPAMVVRDADVVLVLVPAYARHRVLTSIYPYLAEHTWVGGVPGAGGFDWLAREILGDSIRVFGLARTPFICRTETYGASVLLTGIQDRLHLAGFPRAELAEIARILETTLGIPIELLPNYLVVTLTPSNSVVHPSRLYSLFYERIEETTYTNARLFYADWDEIASDILTGCDKEIQQICATLPLDLSQVIPIERHYRLNKRRTLTDAIRGIEPLRNIPAPLIMHGERFVPDMQHRFFKEDIPYGLAVLRGIAEIAGVSTPTIDRLLLWAQQQLHTSFITGELLDLTCCSHLPLPQNFGISNADTLAERSKDGLTALRDDGVEFP